VVDCGDQNGGVPLLAGPAIVPGSFARLPQPVLELDDAVLRPWQASDAPDVVRAYAEPSIQQWHVRSMTEDEARAWIGSWPHRWAQEAAGGWAIADGSGLLGQISLRRLDLGNGLGEVSYWVLPPARGRRLATRAVRALSGWVFEQLQLHRVELTHSTANPASCRVAERAGYRLEGTKRREGLHADGWHDMHLHARLVDDPPQDAAAPARRADVPRGTSL
jgi:RimJ/RimL family protein N-acetyltransferase